MSEIEKLSPIAKHALWVSCMDSDVPVQLADPATVERVSALLRSESPADTKGRTSSARPPVPPSITVPGALPETPNGSPPNGAPL
jgi:hypothetical protein